MRHKEKEGAERHSIPFDRTLLLPGGKREKKRKNTGGEEEKMNFRILTRYEMVKLVSLENKREREREI